MNKAQVKEDFKNYVLPAVVLQYGKDDQIAKAEAWNNFTDALCKDGFITRHQDETWDNPY